MGMYNLIADNEEKFYTTAETVIGECESFAQFTNRMTEHLQLLQGSGDLEHWEDALHELWQEYWSKYI